ncbi:MAG: hypothetical protein ACOY9Y_14400 [Bacillota bacterium]
MKRIFLLLVILSLCQFLLVEREQSHEEQIPGAVSEETANPLADQEQPFAGGQLHDLMEPEPIPLTGFRPSLNSAGPPGTAPIPAKGEKGPVKEPDGNLAEDEVYPDYPRLNPLTKNLNVLFIGASQQELLMAAVYSINYRDRYQSAAVFFPTDTFFPPERPVPGKPLRQARSLETIFQEEGPQGLVKAANEALSVELDYYIRIDRRVLQEVEKFINPIVVNDKKVELEDLFTMEVTPADEKIMGALLAELTRPQVYFFHLPKLVLTFWRYLETDFAINPENLWLHYKIARGVDTRAIPKILAPTVPAPWQGRTARVVPEEWLGSILYHLTNTGSKMAQAN